MSVLRIRLLLDFLAVALIIACLAYWWLDNLSHELFGTALFTLVILHNVFNRRWYGSVIRRRMDVTRIVNLVTIVCLAVCMALMLVTSVIISRDLFPFAAPGGAFAVREIHMFAGYWVLFLLGLHLGTRWDVVLTVARGLFRIFAPNAYRSAALRIAALAIAAWGFKSTLDMGFGSKLMLTYSLDMWDFNESTLEFFLNYGSIIGMLASATHYGLKVARWSRQRQS